jgi:hypothetical protein
MATIEAGEQPGSIRLALDLFEMLAVHAELSKARDSGEAVAPQFGELIDHLDFTINGILIEDYGFTMPVAVRERLALPIQAMLNARKKVLFDLTYLSERAEELDL